MVWKQKICNQTLVLEPYLSLYLQFLAMFWNVANGLTYSPQLWRTKFTVEHRWSKSMTHFVVDCIFDIIVFEFVAEITSTQLIDKEIQSETRRCNNKQLPSFSLNFHLFISILIKVKNQNHFFKSNDVVQNI